MSKPTPHAPPAGLPGLSRPAGLAVSMAAEARPEECRVSLGRVAVPAVWLATVGR